jgi:hypothetical protein
LPHDLVRFRPIGKRHCGPGIDVLLLLICGSAAAFEFWLSQFSDEIGVHAPRPSRVRPGVKSCGRS